MQKYKDELDVVEAYLANV